MTHHCLGSHHSQLFILLLLTLQENCEKLVLPLSQLESLLLSKLKSSNLVIKDTHILVHVAEVLFDVLRYVDLMAQCNTSEELNKHVLVGCHGTLQDDVSLVAVIFHDVLQLIRQVVKRELIII